MSYLTGLLLIDAPASALNNLGNIETERNANVSGVKVIYANDGTYPYVSAQAFRYWLRQTITKNAQHLQASPIYRQPTTVQMVLQREQCVGLARERSPPCRNRTWIIDISTLT